jgi:hypothetical protein
MTAKTRQLRRELGAIFESGSIESISILSGEEWGTSAIGMMAMNENLPYLSCGEVWGCSNASHILLEAESQLAGHTRMPAPVLPTAERGH